MNSIRHFKTLRQSGNMEQSPEHPSDIEELVRMYTAVGPAQDASRLAFERRWDRLPEVKRKALVDRLLADGLLPDEVKIALELFAGTVVRLI